MVQRTLVVSEIPTGTHSPGNGDMHSFNIFTNGDILAGGYKANIFESYGQADYWWLRSPVLGNDYAYYVSGDGYVDIFSYVIWDSCGIIYFSIIDMTPT